jgi:lysophospholipase L1-like esterase
MAADVTEESKRIRRRIGCTCLAPFLVLAIGEIAARVWSAVKYSPERIEQLTTHASTRGRFASHPNLPFVLNPDFEGHNALGFRGGPAEARKKPGAHRIVCIGASTTYGNLADPNDSYPAALGRLVKDRPGAWEVLNGGVPGWTSTEILVNFALCVLPLEPDVVVLQPGRNEIFPQAYNHFRPDYTHFRRPGFSFVVSNYGHKELFRWSRLFMCLCTVRGDRFGWSETEEHPLYGGIVWENKPTVAEALANVREPERLDTFRRNLEGIVELCGARKIGLLVTTMQFRPELMAFQELAPSPDLDRALSDLLDRDNDVLREVASRAGVPVAETAKITDRRELFVDDSHLTPEGHALQAQIVYEKLIPLMDAR